MRCEEVMHRAVFARPAYAISAVAKVMRDGNIGFLPVCDEEDRVVGVVTDRDIAMRGIAAGLDSAEPIAKVMIESVIACAPEDDLRRAEELMRRHGVGRVLCIDKAGRLMGVVSLADVAQRENAITAAETLADATDR